MRARVMALGIAGLALGLSALAWAYFALPGRTLVRGHLGDVAIMMVLVAVVSWMTPRASRWVWLGVPMALGLLAEGAQAIGLHGSGLLNELTLGTTFDVLDLWAYAVGLGIAAFVLRGARFDAV